MLLTTTVTFLLCFLCDDIWSSLPNHPGWIGMEHLEQLIFLLQWDTFFASRCTAASDKIAERYEIHIAWLPGHCADEFARYGLIIELSDEFANLGILMRTGKLIIDNSFIDSVNGKWAGSDTDRMAPKIWKKLDERPQKVYLNTKGARSLTLLVSSRILHYVYAREMHWFWTPS